LQKKSASFSVGFSRSCSHPIRVPFSSPHRLLFLDRFGLLPISFDRCHEGLTSVRPPPEMKKQNLYILAFKDEVPRGLKPRFSGYKVTSSRFQKTLKVECPLPISTLINFTFPYPSMR
jgi:hypothetical protein